MREKGILIVVSGFSGSGKGTIMKELLNSMIIMHYLFPQPPEIRVREKKTDGNISSKL